jgi:ATP-dependent RNA/DNA helicase IGHMBP2
MTSLESLSQTLGLLRQERQADLEYYRQKILLRSLHQRVQEGTTWYPVRLKSDYIGTGERLVVELERTNNLEQPHAFQAGKSVSVFSNASGKPEKEHVNGVINYVRDNTMVVTLQGEELPEWIDDGRLGVDVMFDEMTYREMESALREVMKADGSQIAALREILLGNADPEAALTVDPGPTTSPLNASQQEVLNATLRTRDIAFIHGPPGTGKTTTLVEAIVLAVKTELQVLVTAPSNAAVDLLADKLSEKGLNVVRIGHPARVTEATLSKTLDARIAEHVHFPELRTLRKRMEQIKSMALKYKRNFGYAEREQRKLLLQESKALKADADLLEFHIVNDLLQRAEVICCTLVGCSHPVLRGRKYKSAFIDEAGQALEPACWIPLLRCERAIFAGDHQQLPPTIKSNEAARNGLAVTLFEKGIKRHPEKSGMLRVQYRMNEVIMQFSSDYFYQGALVAHDSVKSARLQPHHTPLEFIDTAGCGYAESQDPETLSRYNEQEALLLIRIVEKLIDDIGPEQWLAESISMGIITPYRSQVDLLHKLAEQSTLLEPLHKLTTINTVDAFQGQERDVIAISLVRSNDKAEVGFLGDIRRTNVAMTRARKKLIMVGDSATLGAHPFYVKLLEYVQKGEYYRSGFGE